GRLQERYGWAKDRAEKEVRDFQDSVSKDYPDYK
ncbi:CsbD family protein, partial [Stenotrophomonas sp. HMWF023]